MLRGMAAPRIVRLVVGAALLAITANACGGGLSLEDYFAKMDDLSSSYDQQNQDLQQQVEADLAKAGSNEEALALFKDYLEKSLAAVNDQLSKIEAIDPPDEAEEAHRGLIEAGKGIRDALAGVVNRFDEFQNVEEIGQVFTTDLAAVGQRGDEACNALQDVADEHDIAVDLGCAG
jgi:hypothetical protein